MSSKMAPWNERIRFGNFLNRQKLNGLAVEVGTNRGRFADALLHRWKEGTLYCVDPWIGGYDDMDPASHGDRENDYRIACDRLEKYGSRCQIIRKTSVEAAGQFRDDSLDFVYIDACHQPVSVMQDINTWWPKVKSGGLLAGHDIFCSQRPGEGWDKHIRPIVSNFARGKRIDVFLVAEKPGYNWSYYMVKP